MYVFIIRVVECVFLAALTLKFDLEIHLRSSIGRFEISGSRGVCVVTGATFQRDGLSPSSGLTVGKVSSHKWSSSV